MAQNRPQSNIINKVTIIIDKPTSTGSSCCCFFFFFVWAIINNASFCRVFMDGSVALLSFLHVGSIPVGLMSLDLGLNSVLGLNLLGSGGEPGWWVDPVLIASIFRQKDDRFLCVSSLDASTWTCSNFELMLFCSEILLLGSGLVWIWNPK